MGWVDDVPSLLAGAAVFAYPSRYEGFGLPPLEAMALGVPVVATATGAIPEVVKDAALLVEPGDPDALAQAIDTVLHDDDTRRRLIDRGRARAAGFTWTATGSALAAAYRRAGRG
jgi:alpha-1,3-rhamnosyl/mannosyltransferase